MLSKEVDTAINMAIITYKGDYTLGNPFEELLSLGEIIDRLAVVNFKLFTLKNKVMQSKDKDFKAWASEEDVRLCIERSRLKRCIDEKLTAIVSGECKFNAESKLYE